MCSINDTVFAALSNLSLNISNATDSIYMWISDEVTALCVDALATILQSKSILADENLIGRKSALERILCAIKVSGDDAIAFFIHHYQARHLGRSSVRPSVQSPKVKIRNLSYSLDGTSRVRYWIAVNDRNRRYCRCHQSTPLAIYRYIAVVQVAKTLHCRSVSNPNCTLHGPQWAVVGVRARRGIHLISMSVEWLVCYVERAQYFSLRNTSTSRNRTISCKSVQCAAAALS